MKLWANIADLLAQREELEKRIAEAQAEIERKKEEVKTAYLERFLRYPPDLVDAILSDPDTLESYLGAYEQFKLLGIPLDPQTPLYSPDGTPFPISKDDIHFWLPVTRIVFEEVLWDTVWVLASTGSTQRAASPLPSPALGNASVLAWEGEVKTDPVWRWVDGWPDAPREADQAWAPAIEGGYIVNMSTLPDKVWSALTAFFQGQMHIMTVDQWWQWQQRIDRIITAWNKQNPTQKIHKYLGTVGEKKIWGVQWRELYGIQSRGDFERVFHITFPEQIGARTLAQKTPQRRVRAKDSWAWVAASLPPPAWAEDTRVDRGALPATGWANPASVPNWTGRWAGPVDPEEASWKAKLSNDEAREAISRDFIAILNILFSMVLEKYKKEKAVSWIPGSFTGLSITENKVTTTEGGNAVRGKHIKIVISEIAGEQKPYWEALSSKLWRDMLSRTFAATRNNYPGLSQAMFNDVTETMIDGAVYNEPVFRLMTWQGLSLYIYLPTKAMVSQKKVPDEKKDDEWGTERSEKIAILWLNEALEWYLGWYFDRVLSQGKWILKDHFIDFDTVKRGKTIHAWEQKTELGIWLGERSKRHVAQRDAFHSFPQLTEYILEHPESHLSLKRIEWPQPIRIIYADPTTPGLTIEFSPY